MRALIQAARPLLQALFATGLGIVAFATLSRIGFTLETSLIGALILAGALNISALASLNGDGFLPTCEGAMGES
jgi:CHASE2 domain-containing sensor protein